MKMLNTYSQTGPQCEARPAPPTREGSVESEIVECKHSIAGLGDALQELRGRLGVVLRNVPISGKQDGQSSNPGQPPIQCTIAANIASIRRDINNLRSGVGEMMDLLDLN